jgi:hypothetical protein
MTYQEYDINGYTFYTEERDKGGNYQNSSVTMMSYTGEEKKRYYRNIEEIWDLDYIGEKLPMFLSDGMQTSQKKTNISPICVCPKPTNPRPRTPPCKMSHGYWLGMWRNASS